MRRVSGNNNDAVIQQQYRPFAFLLARTERGDGYSFLFEKTKHHLKVFEDFELNFSAFCQDHSLACSNAVQYIWPLCDIVLCWPHIKRTAIAHNASKLIDHKFKEIAQLNITYLHFSRSTEQFEALLSLMLSYWEEKGEEALANWFSAEYGTKLFNKWHVTSSNIPGHTPNNNSQESARRNWKRNYFQGRVGKHQQVSMGVFLKETIPSQMKMLTEDVGTEPINQMVKTLPERFALDKATELVAEGLAFRTKKQLTNYFSVKSSSTIGETGKLIGFDGYVFNASSHIWQNDTDYTMNKSRAQSYCLSLQGFLQATWSFDIAMENTHNCHAVKVLPGINFSSIIVHPTNAANSLPTTTSPEPITHSFTCDCKSWWTTLACSHVLAAMHLMGD